MCWIVMSSLLRASPFFVIVNTALGNAAVNLPYRSDGTSWCWATFKGKRGATSLYKKKRRDDPLGTVAAAGQ